jgi:hypothetical protein
MAATGRQVAGPFGRLEEVIPAPTAQAARDEREACGAASPRAGTAQIGLASRPSRLSAGRLPAPSGPIQTRAQAAFSSACIIPKTFPSGSLK